jgi:hypothetical protein
MAHHLHFTPPAKNSTLRECMNKNSISLLFILIFSTFARAETPQARVDAAQEACNSATEAYQTCENAASNSSNPFMGPLREIFQCDGEKQWAKTTCERADLAQNAFSLLSDSVENHIVRHYHPEMLANDESYLNQILSEKDEDFLNAWIDAASDISNPKTFTYKNVLYVSATGDAQVSAPN